MSSAPTFAHGAQLGQQCVELYPGEKSSRHFIGEPNAILGTVEFKAFSIHETAGNAKNSRTAVTRSYHSGSRYIRREMHVLSGLLQETLGKDRLRIL